MAKLGIPRFSKTIKQQEGKPIENVTSRPANSKICKCGVTIALKLIITKKIGQLHNKLAKNYEIISGFFRGGDKFSTEDSCIYRR